VLAQIDGKPEETIGYVSPKAALQTYLADGELGLKQELIKVHERKIGGTTLAFATVYSRHFRDRQFFQYTQSVQEKLSNVIPPMGVCIEGIRVEFTSPGFGPRSGIMGMVNCEGMEAPKTNVARSSLESEAEQESLTAIVLRAYLEQVSEEMSRLQSDEGFSLSYSVEQFPYLAGPVYNNSFAQTTMVDQFKNFPMFMIEDSTGRRAVSIAELRAQDGFWTVESASMSSLIQLLKDTPSTTTCKQVAEFSKFRGAPLPAGNLVTNSDLSSMARMLLESDFEICELRASIADRRIDARWLPSEPDARRWLSASKVEREAVIQLQNELRAYRRYREERRRRQSVHTVQLGLTEFPCVGLDNYFGVVGMGAPRLLPGTPVAQFLRSLDPLSKPENAVQCLIFMDALGPCFENTRSDSRALRSEIEFVLKETTARLEGQLQIDVTGFLDALAQTEGRLAVFNPWSWERSESASDLEF